MLIIKSPQPTLSIKTFTSEKNKMEQDYSLVYTFICNINNIYHNDHGNKVGWGFLDVSYIT